MSLRYSEIVSSVVPLPFSVFLVWDTPCERLYYSLLHTSLQAPSRRHPPTPPLTSVRPIPPPPRAPSTPTSERHPPSRPTAARHPPTPGGICNPSGPGPARSVPPRSTPPAPAAAPPGTLPNATLTDILGDSHPTRLAPTPARPRRLAPLPPDSGGQGGIRLQPALRVTRSTPVPTDPAHYRPNPMQLGTLGPARTDHAHPIAARPITA